MALNSMSIHVLAISSKDQLGRYKNKIQKDTGVRQKESLTEQIIAEQKETNKLLAEQKVFYTMTLNNASSIQSTDNWDGKSVSQWKIRVLRIISQSH